MTLTTNGDGLLVFGDEDFGAFFIDFHFADFGGGKGFADVFGRIVAPVDDVDFFAIADFIHNGLDADAATTDKGTDGINAWNICSHGDLGAAASFAGDGFDFDGAILDFGDFLTEEILDKFGIAATEDELGATLIAFDAFDEDF